MKLELTLPYPPTINHYYTNYRGVVRISEKGRDYRQKVIKAILALRVGGKIATGVIFGVFRLQVVITAHMPDNRIRDIDNLLKCLLDALTHAKIWDDDSQIDRLTIIRGGVDPGKLGFCSINIEEL